MQVTKTIQGVENSFGKVTCWPQQISEFLSHMPVCNVASDWPHTILCPSCFCLAYQSFCKQNYYFVEAYRQMLL